ncbi:hypothetical protein, partial [Massilia sp. CFBP 13721]|uniref:hypothetical protein n=1 Tax=Massilia sp. CFBP 13721 TaxID=2775300 RepID=UPI001A7E1CE3
MDLDDASAAHAFNRRVTPRVVAMHACVERVGGAWGALVRMPGWSRPCKGKLEMSGRSKLEMSGFSVMP